jgi:hypothetical protein
MWLRMLSYDFFTIRKTIFSTGNLDISLILLERERERES